MKILIASPYLPWPLGSGGNAAQFSTLQCLAQDHTFTLVCPINSKAEGAHALELAKQLPNVKIRGVGCAPPQPHLAVKAATFLKDTARDWIKGSRSPFGESAPFYPFHPLHPAYIEALTEELTHRPDLCQVEFAEMMPLGLWLPAAVPKLFIHHQIHFVYAERFVETHGKKPFSEYLTEWMRGQELLYLRRFDAVVTFSEEDRRLLSGTLAMPPVYTSPFPIPADVGVSQDIPLCFDGRFLFLGSEGHGPNRGALSWLLEGIWPKIIAKMPAARLVVIGAWTDAWIKNAQVKGVSYVGFVPDLASVLRGGIMLVPLRIGSGIRTKILAALAQGVPVITTGVGAEGLLVREGEDLIVRNDAATFADAGVELAQNPELWQKLARNGHHTVVRHYSAEEVRRRRNEIYAGLAASTRSSPSAAVPGPTAIVA